ncbi:MAG TPA: hypothetical protein VEF34_04845 [Syntrophobacteraceae bacterium]|nr:hypothetical protein [Syntrophobacteraceae bacterium]
MITSNYIVEGELDEHLKKLEEKLQATVLAFLGPILYGVDKEIRDAVEGIGRVKKEKLAVVLQTPGGYIEVVERMVNLFRSHFGFVDFIIPDHAMSAGTVLVMSGDTIYMDYFSVLGPIDPQVERPNSKDLIPALGYLAQYERLIKKSDEGTLSTAELHYLVERFDPAEMYQFEQIREQSIALLKDWLVKYKFRNWNTVSGRSVTMRMKRNKAAFIARKLNDIGHWHSHQRGISKDVLINDLNLHIDDFGADPDLNLKIRSYDKLINDYMMRRGHVGVIHTYEHYIPLMEGR